ncbi:hypothetical protein, partial [Kitasatospora cinereorecta]
VIEDNQLTELTTDEERILHKVAGNKIYQVYDQSIANIKEAIGPFMPKGIAAQKNILEFCEQHEIKPDDQIEFCDEVDISLSSYKGKMRTYRAIKNNKTVIETSSRAYFYRSDDGMVYPILAQISSS